MPKYIKDKRIMTADSDELRSNLGQLHEKIHTPEGLHAFDQPRRSLVEHGMKIKKIAGELASREPGYQNPCKHCDPHKHRNLSGGQFGATPPPAAE